MWSPPSPLTLPKTPVQSTPNHVRRVQRAASSKHGRAGSPGGNDHERINDLYFIRVFPNATLVSDGEVPSSRETATVEVDTVSSQGRRGTDGPATVPCLVVPTRSALDLPSANAGYVGTGGAPIIGTERRTDRDADERTDGVVEASVAPPAPDSSLAALLIDESHTFQFLWCLFSFFLVKGVPITVQLEITVPTSGGQAPTTRRVFGRLEGGDVRMGVPAGRGADASAYTGAGALFPMYFALSVPPIVRTALQSIPGFSPGTCIDIHSISLSPALLSQLPLASATHHCLHQAVLYRGDWGDDKTYRTVDRN